MEMRKGAKILARKKMLLAMEYICRQINDEDIVNSWLSCGVPDGEIPYGELDLQNIGDDNVMLEDESFKDIMLTFLNCVSRAKESGGLYCGDVVADKRHSELKDLDI